MRIDSVSARSTNDTRGRATIETAISSAGFIATASVPSGKSTGIHEALELRDADGSVTRAIENVNTEIKDALCGRDFASLDEIDTLLIELDGTPNKSRLGANAILSVSIAAQRLLAAQEGVPLWKSIAKRGGTTPSAPRLYMNVMNGGTHADFKLPFQEYILVVEGEPAEAFSIAQEAFAKLGERLGNVPMGDEGGYAPTFATLEEPFEILADLVKEFPHTFIAIDAAASEFFQEGTYQMLGKSYTADDMTHIYESLVSHFPLESIEDPFDEESGDDFARLTTALGPNIRVIGDDLTVTNPIRVKEALLRKEINTVLIKPNQVGTVMEALQAVKETYAAGCGVVASHRSGETSDTFIADFAYGVGAYGIKAGGLGQRERLEKYERLLAIEQEANIV
ncbi:MAG: phosphopyruvate hydratase [Candidatus Kaiserbacteria bacterium]|nr:phosphopyruvate hydratase [Candidatus Kaiserbacteria bacterium]